MLHRTTNGLTKGRLHEDLILDDYTKVQGQLVQYLTSFQLHGIRFLHQHYIVKSNCILNDDKYLGKCFQTTVFLSSISFKERSAFKCLILCKSREKLLNWLYHIELLTDLSAAEFKSHADFQNNSILVQLVAEITDKPNLSTIKLWDYAIFDETGKNLFTDNDIVTLNQIETKVKLILSTRDIAQNVRHLRRILVLLNGKNHKNEVFTRILGKFKNSDSFIRVRELLICYCKSFLLRRYRREITSKLPRANFTIYQENFNTWCDSKGYLHHERNEIQSTVAPDLPNSQNTEEMAPLVLDSDTEDEQVELHELMKFHRKSSDVEILTQKIPSPFTLSSENLCHRQSSPDLFESLDEDDSEKTTTYDVRGSLCHLKFKEKLNNEKVSTPIIAASTTQWSELKQQNSDDLFEGIATMIEEEEIIQDVNSGKLFEETNRTCVFEITRNDEFPNVIRINSDTEMSPVDNHNKSLLKSTSDSPNSKYKNSLDDRKSNKSFHYFFDHETNNENVQNSIEFINEEKIATNNQCVTPKSSKTSNASESSLNSNRWISKNCSSVKRKLSESFEKVQSKRLKDHNITKLQDKPNGSGVKKHNPQTGADQVADSCSVLFKSKKRFLSRSLASSDDEY